VSRLDGKWGQTAVELPQGEWTNRLNGARVGGGKVAIGNLLLDFPVALLVKN
jgi:maltooligosyltrehalose synthase